MFFISSAFADAGASQAGGLMSFLPLIAFVGILYFLLIRPQQKRQKQHQELIASIKKGDKVVTSSGMIATVSKVIGEHEVILEIANGVHCKFVKSAISNVVAGNQIQKEPASKDNEPKQVANENNIPNEEKLTEKASFQSNKQNQMRTPQHKAKLPGKVIKKTPIKKNEDANGKE